MRKTIPKSSYNVFLLRIWRPDAEVEWRASLQPGGDETLLHFESLRAVYHFLHQHFNDELPGGDCI